MCEDMKNIKENEQVEKELIDINMKSYHKFDSIFFDSAPRCPRKRVVRILLGTAEHISPLSAPFRGSG